MQAVVDVMREKHPTRVVARQTAQVVPISCRAQACRSCKRSRFAPHHRI
ncbi:hypothetical protein AKJ09_07887 [Labilithrix luteola]|uniref:Uncharacterized protein n=1 Tax=Labilithrix luteola TaxID=1391654 RepID=A0A0K1Q689_9BACT|nr:hypothetical protein AKJ09_07887 [Labilithrix luteola]